MLLEGIFLPLTTPFHPDGRLHLRKLSENVAHYSRTPAAGMMVLGAVGESASLTDREALEVLHAAIEAAAPEKVMIAAIDCGSVHATIERAEAISALGYDVAAIETPATIADPAMTLERLTYFRAIADRSPLPILISGTSLSLDELSELSTHPQILGAVPHDHIDLTRLKAATTNISHEADVTTIFAAVTRRMQRTVHAASTFGGVAVLDEKPALKTRKRKVGFQCLTTSTAGMLEAWQSGAVGSIPRLGPCAPQACYEVWQAFKDDDLPLAEEKQERLRRTAQYAEGPSGIASIKYACDWNGYFGGSPRLPLLPLTEDLRRTLEADLIGMRN